MKHLVTPNGKDVRVLPYQEAVRVIVTQQDGERRF